MEWSCGWWARRDCGHHWVESAVRGKNFAGLLALWDILFGSFDLPIGAVLSRRRIYPFRRS